MVGQPPINPITTALLNLAKADREAEERRLLKRKKRLEAAETRERTGSLSLDASSPNTSAATTTAGGDVAPEPGTGGVPKKSALKNAKKAPSEAQAFAASNKTLSMALGFGGSGGKKLSWMKQSTEPTNPYLAGKKEAALKTAKGSGEGGKGGRDGVGDEGTLRARNWGAWREDGDEGTGIQLRDLIAVLEGDGKEKRALQRAYMRLNGLGGTGVGRS